MRSPTLCILFLAPAACGGVSQAPAGSPSSPAPVSGSAAVPGSVSYTAGTARYRVVSHAHLEQQIEGNKQESNFLVEYLATVTLSPDGPRLRMTFAIDSIRAEGGVITAAEIARGQGARVTGFVSPDGQVSDVAGDSVLTGQLQNIASGIRTFFPRIPAGGAQPGQRWTDTTETKNTVTAQLTIRSINDRSVVDWTERGGTRALQLDVTGRYTITGTGQQMGQEFTINGGGERHTYQYLSADGRYLGTTNQDSSNVTIALSAMGMSFPSIQVRADTVSLIP